jgi:hypothetical protein
MPMKFRHLPAAGRVIVVVVAVGVFAVAAAACATSYHAIYRLVSMLGLYGAGITRTYPMLVDVAFLLAESAAILGGIMRAVTRSDEVTRSWPYITMWLCGLCTIAFNVWHAYLIGGRADPLTVPRCIVASLPPVLMMVSFQVLISIVKWVMLHLGRPLNSAHALSPMGAVLTVPPGGPAGYAQPGVYAPAGMQNPQVTDGGNPQNGHAGSKREQVEQYLAALTPQELATATGKSVTARLTASGVPVGEHYVSQILGQWRTTANGRRRRGSRR